MHPWKSNFHGFCMHLQPMEYLLSHTYSVSKIYEIFINLPSDIYDMTSQLHRMWMHSIYWKLILSWVNWLNCSWNGYFIGNEPLRQSFMGMFMKWLARNFMVIACSTEHACQCWDFLTELCYNTIISCFNTSTIRSLYFLKNESWEKE